ncbi:unnamed protein product [Oikopleura dioica]|uniref:Uncharacterized protein n=1 Tax=Oikopleura dioica TaxID=34765 RepID=E4XAK3_OIKDI|nr:unnamed protein product [Oikopleura dioica]
MCVPYSHSRAEIDAVRWVSIVDGKIPENAIPIGKDADNRVLYAGRCQVRQNRYRFVPGYVSREEPRVITAYGTRARTGNRNEVLVSDKIDSLYWESSLTPRFPVVGGSDEEEKYLIGRTRSSFGKTWRGRRLSIGHYSDGFCLPGKVHPSHSVLYAPFGDKEYIFKDFETMAIRASPRSLFEIAALTLKINLEDEKLHSLADEQVLSKPVIAQILAVSPR